MTRRLHGGTNIMRSISNTLFGSGEKTPAPTPASDSSLPEIRAIHDELVNTKNEIIAKLNHFDELKKTMSNTLEDARKTQQELLRLKSRRNHLQNLQNISNSQQEEVDESNNDVKVLGEQHEEERNLNIESPSENAPDNAVVNPMLERDEDQSPSEERPLSEGSQNSASPSERPLESPSESPSERPLESPSESPSDRAIESPSESPSRPLDSPSESSTYANGQSSNIPEQGASDSDSENLFQDINQPKKPVMGGSRRRRRYVYRRRSLRR